MIVPTPVFPKTSNTASVKISFSKRPLIATLLGLLHAFHTLYPKPFLLLKGSPFSPFLFQEIFPTFSHKTGISFSHPLHSLKRWSLVCLPFLHHQQESGPAHFHFSRSSSVNGTRPGGSQSSIFLAGTGHHLGLRGGVGSWAGGLFICN